MRDQLNDPLFYGRLPDVMKPGVDAVRQKDVADWTHTDCLVAGHAVTWSLCHS